MPALQALLDVDSFYQLILMFFSIKHQQCCFSTSILLNLFKAMKTKTCYIFEVLFQYNQIRSANQCHQIRFKIFLGEFHNICVATKILVVLIELIPISSRKHSSLTSMAQCSSQERVSENQYMHNLAGQFSVLQKDLWRKCDPDLSPCST